MVCALPLLACEADDGDLGRSPEVRAFTAADVAPALPDESPIRFVEDDGTEGGRLVPSDIKLIYEEIRTQDASNRELSRQTRGTLTLEIWQRTSHPQFYLDASEPYVYHEEGGTTYLEDGTQRHHYRIRRQPNGSRAEKPVTPPGPPRVDALVFEKWAEAAEDGFIELNARLSGIPDYQPPPIPPPGMFTAEEDRRAQAQRDAYLRTYYENFNTRAGRFQAEVEAAGGRTVELMPDIGWIRIRVPSRHVEHLIEHSEIDRLTSPYVFEPEDMSHKNEISDLYLQLNARWPDANNKCYSSNAFYSGRIDSSQDIRHMVARTSAVGGKCAELQIHKRHVTSAGAVVHVHCYYSSKDDDDNVLD